jgi:hypothetical protein
MKLAEKLKKILEVKIPNDMQGKIKYVKKKGNILTFKNDDVEFDGKKRKQIIVDKFNKSASGFYIESEKLKLLGNKQAKTKTYNSEEDLVNAVDWHWMSKNVMD